jgi:hypothetical protein
MRPALPSRERRTRGADHLIGPDQPRRVAGRQGSGRTRIEGAEMLAHTDPAERAVQRGSFLADRRRNMRHRRQTLLQCP